MARWSWVVCVAMVGGCEISVGSDAGKSDTSTTDGSDPSNPGDDPDTTDPDPTEDPTGGGTTTAPASCAAVFPGTYGGADSGEFEAEYLPATSEILITSVSSQGILDGVLSVDASGAVYGESQGYWMDGTIDLDTCAMSGDWGVVAAPGIDAGWWEAGP